MADIKNPGKGDYTGMPFFTGREPAFAGLFNKLAANNASNLKNGNAVKFINSDQLKKQQGSLDLRSLDDNTRKQTGLLGDLGQQIKNGNTGLKSYFESSEFSNRKIIESLHKLTEAVKGIKPGGSSGGGLLDVAADFMGGGSGRGASRGSRLGSALGRAAKIGGRIAGPLMGAYGLYASSQELSETRNTPFFGNEETGVMGSRASNYLGSTASGAITGATIGTMVAPGIGTAIGAGVGGAIGLTTAAYSDFKPQVDSAAKAVTEKASETAKMVWGGLAKISDKGFNYVKDKLPSWDSVSGKIQNLIGTAASFVSDLANTVGKLMTDIKDYIKSFIPSMDTVRGSLGLGPSAPDGYIPGNSRANTGRGTIAPGNPVAATTDAPSVAPDGYIPGNSRANTGRGTIAPGNPAAATTDAPSVAPSGYIPGNNRSGANTSSDGLNGKITNTSVAGNIGRGESRGGDPNIFNSGAGNNYKVGTLDSDNTTLSEVQRRQNLSLNDPNKIFAAGSYQVIPTTMRDAVKALKLDPDTKFNQETQNKIFTDYLATKKRPDVGNYITGKSDNLNAAHLGLAQEFASISYNGKSIYDKDGINHSSVSDESIKKALQQARADYKAKIDSGMDKQQATREALLGVKNTTQGKDGENTASMLPTNTVGAASTAQDAKATTAPVAPISNVPESMQKPGGDTPRSNAMPDVPVTPEPEAAPEPSNIQTSSSQNNSGGGNGNSRSASNYNSMGINDIPMFIGDNGIIFVNGGATA